MLNIAGIDYESFTDGEGCRCTIFISGCEHRCPNCHNPETWDFNYGTPLTEELVNEINHQLDKRPFLSGITISGGDPVYSLSGVMWLINKLHIPNDNIWMYTGFTWDEVVKRMPFTSLEKFNVIVDGLYDDSLRDITLKFRGSSNQRLIDVKKTLESGSIVLFDC